MSTASKPTIFGSARVFRHPGTKITRLSELIEASAATENGPGEWLGHCPAPEHSGGDQRPSFLIFARPGRVGIECRVCGTPAYGQLLSGLQLTSAELHGLVQDELYDQEAAARVKLLADDEALQVLADQHQKRVNTLQTGRANAAVEYLVGRHGLTEAMITALGLGAMQDRDGDWSMIWIPMKDTAGKIIGAQQRFRSGERRLYTDRKRDLRFSQAGYFGGNDSEVVLVTEGESDGLTAFAAGYDTVWITGAGKSSREVLDLIRSAAAGRDVVVAGDCDRAGQRFNDAIGSKIIGSRQLGLPADRLPDKGDLTDWYALEPSGFRDELRAAISKAEVSELTEEAFWASRDYLQVIAQGADARLVNRWGVLGFTLGRVSASTSYDVVIPTQGGGTLNVTIGLLGGPSAGKGQAQRASDDFFKIDDEARRPKAGSGEAVPELFARRLSPKDVAQATGDDREQLADRAALGDDGEMLEWMHREMLMYWSEADTLMAVSGRQGSTLGPLLREAFDGESIGRHLVKQSGGGVQLPAMEYRLSVIVGVQPARLGPIIEDRGGTAQRFLFVPCELEAMPDEDVLEPVPFQWHRPPSSELGAWPNGFRALTISETIKNSVKADRRAQAWVRSTSSTPAATTSESRLHVCWRLWTAGTPSPMKTGRSRGL